MKAQNRIFLRSCAAFSRKVAGCLEPKMAPPQKVCGSHLSQKWLASVFHTLTHAACPHGVPEPRWLPQSLRQKPLGPGRPLCSHQEGGWLLGAEDGATSEALWLSPVPETAGLCIPHPHPCSLPSAESWSQGDSHHRGLRHKPLGLADP